MLKFLGKQKLYCKNRDKKPHFRITTKVVVFSFSFLIIAFTLLTFDGSVSATAVQSTLTLGTSTNTLLVDLQPTTTGTFGDSGNATINVRTDNFTGYTLSVEASSSTDLNGPSNNKINTLSSIVSSSDFSNSANTQYNNKWGFKPSQYIDNSDPSNPTTISNSDNYLPSPTTTGITIDKTNVSNPTVDNTYTISIGARINKELKAGAYTNTFIVRALSNVIVYNINYNQNTSDTVNSMPSPNPQGAEIAGGTPVADSKATLSSTTPTRTGYTFAGWCDVHTIDNPSTGNQTCGGITYQPGSDFGIDQTSNYTNVILYAIWETATYNITLDKNGGTGGSNSTTVGYKATTLGSVTNPTKANDVNTRTISGFTAGTGATDATITYSSTQPSGSTCNSASNCTSTSTTTYSLSGWYEEAAATNQIASVTINPVLLANTSYTNSSNQWTDTSGSVTLYAGWTASAGSYSSVTLPTIIKEGHTCHWNTNSSDTGTSYNSGASITPGSDLTLYGFCSINTYAISFTFDSNISNIVIKDSTGTSTIATISTSGSSYNLTYDTTYKIIPTFANNYELDSMTKTTGQGTLSDDLFTVGDGTATINTTSKGGTCYLQSLTYSGTGLSFVEVRTEPGLGGSVMRPSSVGTTSLTCGTTYYLYAETDPFYEANSWTATGSVTLSSTTDPNPSFVINGNDGEIVLNSTTTRTNMISLGSMQNLTASACSSATSDNYYAVDSRDNKNYTVRYINGSCWMTRNIAIGCAGSGINYSATVSSRSLTSTTSNVSSSWSTPTALLTTAAYNSSTSGYTTAAMMCNTTYGGHYNYKAATAGTISGSPNTNNADYDICPRGWRLPTQSEFSDITSYMSEFKPLNSGNYGAYGAGVLRSGYGSFGQWWAATASSSGDRRPVLNFGWNSSVDPYAYGLKSNYTSMSYQGNSVRCIRST